MAQMPLLTYFSRGGLAMGWGVRRFRNNIYMFSNPTEFGTSPTPYKYYKQVYAQPNTQGKTCRTLLTIKTLLILNNRRVPWWGEGEGPATGYVTPDLSDDSEGSRRKKGEDNKNDQREKKKMAEATKNTG